MKFVKKGDDLTKDVLEDLYLVGMKSTIEIGEMYGMSDVGVQYRLKSYGIPIWSQKDRNLNLAVKNGFPDLRKVSKDELSSLYDNIGMKKLGDMFGVSRILIKSHLKGLGIGLMTKTDRVEKRLPKEFTQEQKSLIFGSLLGDGSVGLASVNPKSKTARYSEHHSLKQRGYLDWKIGIYGDFVSCIKKDDKVTNDGGTFYGFRITTVHHRIFYDFHKMFYDGKQKRLPKEFEELIDPMSLATWYMDDGFLQTNQYCISTTFEQSDIDVVVDVLKKRFGLEIEDRVRQQGDYLPIHILYFKDSDKFFEFIKPHVPQCMKYKILRKHLFLLPYFEDLVIKSEDDIPDVYDDNRMDDIVDYFHAVGFPYPSYDRSLRETIKSLKENLAVIEGSSIIGGVSGNRFLLSIFHNFFDVGQNDKASAVDSFENDLKHMIKDIYLKYKKKPTDGLLRTVCMEHARISGFKPSIAKYIYDRYCPEGGTVLDPCGGWGGRMLGFYCSKADRYDCIEANFKTFRNLRKLSILLGREIKKSVTCQYGAFEDIDLKAGYDLVFTSPPYFRKELYSEDGFQSCVRYADYEEWKESFLKPFVLKSFDVLKSGGYFVVNIDDVIIDRVFYPLRDDFLKMCFGLFKSMDFLFMNYRNRYTGVTHGEPIYVLQKP